MKKKKILITGSLGYLGTALTQYFREEGYPCRGFDIGFFRDGLLYPYADPETTLGDMRFFEEKYLEGIDCVIHLAAISNDPFGNLSSERIYDPTRIYARELARLCKKRGIKFIFPSSCSVYGVGQDDLMNEDSPTLPQTPYSLNKIQVEEDLKEMSDQNFSPVILRLATVFGLSARMRFDLVINMLTAMALTTGKIMLNSNGKAWRPNVYILDVCRAMQCAVDYEHQDGPLVLNVGDDSQNFQILDIARMIREEVPGCEIIFLNKKDQFIDLLSTNQKEKVNNREEELIRDRKIQDGVDKRTYRVSFSRIKNIFPGFQCRWTVQSGVNAMRNVFKKIRLTEADFKNINYYRLQKLEYLHKENVISDDLLWVQEKVV